MNETTTPPKKSKCCRYFVIFILLLFLLNIAWQAYNSYKIHQLISELQSKTCQTSATSDGGQSSKANIKGVQNRYPH